MKRQRGRGRKPGGGGGGGHHNNNQGNYSHQPNRALESNGPDVKVRGPAALIYERYLQLARDATSAGDRVLGENYLQHADHYFRLLRSMQPAAPPPTERYSNESEYEGDDEGGGDNEAPVSEVRARGEQPETEAAPGQQPQPGERDDGELRQRRGRRNRFRPGGEGEAGDNRQPREGREPRENGQAERREHEEPGANDGPEGFSGGPRPAFLRTE